MRTVELVAGVKSSVLGFGCAPILGSVDSDRARRALQTALQHGVTHLDIAPSYGYGEAESWLGRELKGRRDEVVIATKFGIEETAKARWLRSLKPLVRWAKRVKGLRKSPSHGVLQPVPAARLGPGLGDLFHRRVQFTPSKLIASVERSLRRLRTDRLDFLLLHEPSAELAEIDGIQEAAMQLKGAGKIRGWGLAYMREQRAIHAHYLDRFDVLQFDLSWGGPDYEAVRDVRRDHANIFFSPFRSLPPEVSRAEALTALSADFPRSVILCSMFNPDHIRANARSL